MKQIYDTLQLIPVDKIDLHEAFEPSRLEKRKRALLKNSIYVIQCSSLKHYLVAIWSLMVYTDL